MNKINRRIQQKHDTQQHWELAENFIPLAGEIIIYEDNETRQPFGFKIGDGVLNQETGKIEGTKVNDLPFMTEDVAIFNGEGENAIQQALRSETFTLVNDNINNNTDVQRAENGEIIAGALGFHAASFNGRSQALGKGAFAEGVETVALGKYSHAQGNATFAAGGNAHSEGLLTSALGESSHAEGDNTSARGMGSHSEGNMTGAYGNYSHAEGEETLAIGDYQHVQGKCNIEDTENKYAHIVGNGSDYVHRSNAHTIDWQGNGWFAGTVKVGGTGQDDENAKELATKEYSALMVTVSTDYPTTMSAIVTAIQEAGGDISRLRSRGTQGRTRQSI